MKYFIALLVVMHSTSSVAGYRELFANYIDIGHISVEDNLVFKHFQAKETYDSVGCWPGLGGEVGKFGGLGAMNIDASLGKVFKTPSKPEWCELGVSEKIAE